MKNPNWTELEDKIILDNWSKIKHLTELVNLIPNRNYNAIKSRCGFLKLRKIYIYYKDEKFFETPNMINSYWAAMIATDGYVGIPYKTALSRGGYKVQLGLKTEDVNHIQKFINDTKSNYTIYRVIKKDQWIKTTRNPIGNKHDVDMSMVYFYKAQKWVEDLNKNWSIPFKNKTFDLKRPNISHIYHQLAYLKGLICGDGSITTETIFFTLKDGTKNSFTNLRIDFLGTKDLLNWVKEITDNILGFNSGKGRRASGRQVSLERTGAKIYKYRITGYDAMVLFYILRNFNCPGLDRKWNNPIILQHVEKNFHKIKNLIPVFWNKVSKYLPINNLNGPEHLV